MALLVGNGSLRYRSGQFSSAVFGIGTTIPRFGVEFIGRTGWMKPVKLLRVPTSVVRGENWRFIPRDLRAFHHRTRDTHVLRVGSLRNG